MRFILIGFFLFPLSVEFRFKIAHANFLDKMPRFDFTYFLQYNIYVKIKLKEKKQNNEN